MLIIIEGIDCSGKSYVSERLTKRMKDSFLLKHGNRPKSDDPDEIRTLKKTYSLMLELYQKVIEPVAGVLILDRFYPSELVYSFPMRGYEADEDPFYKDLEKQALALKAIVIMVVASKQTLIQRLRDRGDEHISEKDIDSILDRYKIFHNTTKLPIYTIRSDQAGIDGVLQLLKSL